MKKYEITLFIMGCPYNPATCEKVEIEAESEDDALEQAHDYYFPKGYGVYDATEITEEE